MPTLSWEQLYLIEPDRPLRSPRQPLTGLPLVILVGLTGVGKSTALAQLANIGIAGGPSIHARRQSWG